MAGRASGTSAAELVTEGIWRRALPPDPSIRGRAVKNSDIRVGSTYEVRLRRHTVQVRVASRAIVRGEWWNCLDVATGNTRLAHCSEFVRCNEQPSPQRRIARPTMRRRRSRLATIATVLSIMPLAYVLSVGPAYGMQRRAAISESTFDTVYWPLLHLAGRHETVQALLSHYSKWWV
jgi:hypothetical protein